MTGFDRGKKYKQYIGKPICVVWQDPCGDTSWQDPEEAKMDKPATCVSLGWLLACETGSLVLFSNYNNGGAVGSTLTVPIAIVQEVFVMTAESPNTHTDRLIYLSA